MTLPLKRAETGPTFILAVARKPLSSVFSSSSQPGMHTFSTSGSFSLAHTASRGAASWTSPFIVMAIVVPPRSLRLLPPSKARRRQKEEHIGTTCDAYSQRNKPMWQGLGWQAWRWQAWGWQAWGWQAWGWQAWGWQRAAGVIRSRQS